MEVICVSDTVKHGPIECMISALVDMKHQSTAVISTISLSEAKMPPDSNSANVEHRSVAVFSRQSEAEMFSGTHISFIPN